MAPGHLAKKAFNRITLSILALSVMGLYATLSINDTQHNSIEYRYAECCAFIVVPSVIVLNVIIVCVIMLNVIILSDIMLNVIILSVIMLSGVAPGRQL
jgi:hypothetical protein